MNEPFQLTQLERKEPGQKKKKINIIFNKKQEVGEPERNMDKDEEKEEDENIVKTPKVNIVDKRKKTLLNRADILERLKLVNPTAQTQLVSRAPAPIAKPIEQENEIELEQLIQKTKETEKEPKTGEQEKQKKIVQRKKVVFEKEQEEKKQEEKEEEKQQEMEELEPIIPLEKSTTEKPAAKKKMTKKELKLQQMNEPIADIDLSTVKIGELEVSKRIPQGEKHILKVSPYYINNRKLFIQKLNSSFRPYKEEMLTNKTPFSCDSVGSQNMDFELLTHQLVVRDYLNLYTPYRGLLLFHGLGSGKTCTSIGIAEGMKTDKRIILMTPASLKMNFFSELKKCGDALYKKNQFWEFVSIEGEPQLVGVLSKSLSLPVEYIRENKGAWLVNITKTSNFAQLSETDQKSVDQQLNKMIRQKYFDINYNGSVEKKLKELTQNNNKLNPFDNAVVIIDEAHNLISRISNRIKSKNKKSIAYRLYQYLMDATNVKIVLLTGTPVINQPFEISILFNILRGYIKTWTFPVRITTSQKINRDYFLEIFKKSGLNTFDFVEYSGNNLMVTRNPFGFVNTYKKSQSVKKGGKSLKKQVLPSSKRKTKKNIQRDEEEIPIDQSLKLEETLDYHYQHMGDYQRGGTNVGGADEFDNYRGVQLDEGGNITDVEFQKQMVQILNKHGIQPVGEVKNANYKCLPDDPDDFNRMFTDGYGKVVNIDILKRRILGLTSYFRSAQEELMPSYEKTEDGKNYHVIYSNMSDYQFGVYQRIRTDEREQEMKNVKKKQIIEDSDDKQNSTYRIFSRAACNFTFPAEQPRPFPDKKDKDANISADDFDAVSKKIRKQADDYIEEDNDENQDVDGDEDDVELLNYQKRIENALDFLKYNPLSPRTTEFLTETDLEKYSPKFVKILQNIKSAENKGLHLLYSQFRTIEGIGLIKLVLEANGFAQFKLKKINANGENIWSIDEAEEDINKPKFVLYTGTESAEEKELIRNIYNGAWDSIPPDIAESLKNKHPNNFYGEIIKVFMITSSGAEGISLKNTRYVHIVEPYWNKVRIDQVVGRARRICSHQELPEELRTVKVFIYISKLSKKQLEDDSNIELLTHDLSRLTYKIQGENGKINEKKLVFTTDQTLYEIAEVKDNINSQILTAIKETSIDCSLYNSNPDEPLVCYGYGHVESNQFGSYPTLEMDTSEKTDINVKTRKWTAQIITDPSTKIKYALNPKTNEVYDLDSYEKTKNKTGELIYIGKLVKSIQVIDGKKTTIFKIEKV